MASTQAELVTALQTLLNTVKFRIRNRFGTAATLDVTKLKAGELAFCTDTKQLYACFADGTAQVVSNGIVVKGYYATLAALQAAYPVGIVGDVYAVGSSPQHLYVWQVSAWVDMGTWNDMTLYAANASVVHNSGNESIAGNKTFTGTVTFSNDPVLPNPAWIDAVKLGTWTGHIWYKKVGNRVYVCLDGLTNASAVGTPAYTFPAGLRPGKSAIDSFTGRSSGADVRVVVTTTGDLYLQSPTGGYNTAGELYDQSFDYLAER